MFTSISFSQLTGVDIETGTIVAIKFVRGKMIEDMENEYKTYIRLGANGCAFSNENSVNSQIDFLLSLLRSFRSQTWYSNDSALR